MTNDQNEYRMTLDLSVLEHLGVNLYSTVPAVVSETVANAWDADATEVKIDILDDGNEKSIVVTDNGCGMSRNDIIRKFLTVGYQRRKKDGAKTGTGRDPMGRKGIGKLSLFSIADHIEVYSKSQKGGAGNGLLLDGQGIRDQIKDGEPHYIAPPLDFDSTFPYAHGTRLVIKKFNKKRVNFVSVVQYLRQRLARRFGMQCTEKMAIFVNGDKIKISDRDYFRRVRYLFQYGEGGYDANCPPGSLAVNEKRPSSFNDDGEARQGGGRYAVRGWIGLVERTEDLAGDSGIPAGERDKLNKISVFAREKLGQEDILESFGINSYFARYIIGEIHADFLEEDDDDDLATSSRQSYIEDAAPYRALREFVRKELWNIQKIWDKAREKKGEEKAREILPKEFGEWLDKLPKQTRKKARQFFGKINRSLQENKGEERRMFIYGAQAFESMRLKDALDTLDIVSVENMPEFLQITRELDDLEASYYYNITRERLRVIRKLRGHLDENARERVLQEYIFDHLWLLDPSWDRATELPTMEHTVGKEFGEVGKTLSEEERKGRVDIKYRKTAGVHVIVELKRYSCSVKDHHVLATQVLKYRAALQKCLRQVAGENKAAEPVEIVCILGQNPTGWASIEDEKQGRKVLWEEDIRVVTYHKLIHDAEQAYSEYFEEQKRQGKFLSIIEDALGEDDE